MQTQTTSGDDRFDVEDVAAAIREGRSLRLTQAGQYLLAVANRVLPQLDLAEERLRQFAQGERGALRLPVGNIANRIIGCLLVLPLLPVLADHPLLARHDPAWLAVTFHLVFNLALAALFIPALSLQARLLERILPDRPLPEDAASARYLDPRSLDAPRVALANAAREAFRMADTVEEMLRGSRELLRRDDYRLLDELRRKDDDVQSAL